jgi:hypothetical protein
VGQAIHWKSVILRKQAERPLMERLLLLQWAETIGDFGGVMTFGLVLLSRSSKAAVPSALEGLTAVFGMGTGVPPPL